LEFPIHLPGPRDADSHPDGDRVELAFEWEGDRYQSVLTCHRQGRSVTLFQTREGSPADAWPPSPPLQQLHSQEIDGRPTVLAVGMAGSTHWSASFQPDGSSTLSMEFAARVDLREEIHLGNAFVLSDAVKTGRFTRESAQFAVPELDLVFELHSSSANLVHVPESHSAYVCANRSTPTDKSAETSTSGTRRHATESWQVKVEFGRAPRVT
jgi:hypothetical protein